MITPAIKPTLAFRPISRGLIAAARNSVNKVKESTQTISKGLNKNQKFAMNYVEFFGSKKTTKILKKNLKSIKESLVSTFSMAKILKKRVADISKIGLGGALGGIAGILGKGLLGSVLGKLAIGALIGLAVGGIGYFLYKNTARFFQFLRENIDQLAPIVQSIILRRGQEAGAPSGAIELIDELSQNVNQDVETILKDNPNMKREDAVAQATQANIDTLQLKINDLVEERKGLNKITQFSEVTELNAKIQVLESGQKFLRTGSPFIDIFSRSLLTQRFAGKFAPFGYEKMTENQRLNTVANYVESAPENLDVLKFQILQSSRLGGDDSKMRFYEDVLNYIEAKQKNQTDQFKVLPETVDLDQVRKENIQQLKNEYPNVLDYKPLSKNKKGDLNIINGTPNNQNTNGGSKDTKISSAPPEGGIIDVPFISSLNSDLAFDRAIAKNTYNIYMG